mmetsp:Transcript_71302/g.180533  ORF Transcript_71302/g.180533 Transcript_71302/m.180533 type:complete len:225 (+) Transcript_71302:591-1265(+)
MSWEQPPEWRNVKISMMHHKRLRYVGPYKMRRLLHPAKETGKQRKSASILFWSMQSLSNHTRGSRLCLARKHLLHSCRASHFAAASSCQECETNASQWPSLVGSATMLKCRSGALSCKSLEVNWETSMLRKLCRACCNASLGCTLPTRHAMVAAARVAPRVSIQHLSLACKDCRACGHNTMQIATKFTGTSTSFWGIMLILHIACAVLSTEYKTTESCKPRCML